VQPRTAKEVVEILYGMRVARVVGVQLLDPSA
jgi:hypothetical protein